MNLEKKLDEYRMRYGNFRITLFSDGSGSIEGVGGMSFRDLIGLGRILNLDNLDSLEELRQIVVEYKRTSGFDPSWPFPHIIIDTSFRLVNLEAVVTEAKTVVLLKAATSYE